ncbi:hypothetical protein [Nocardioides terrigena]|uniref:hypothetical protein n=1 Tax=Nocardioides terrigena TaxID=424797 RepID=UPI000D31AA53|nr:hypothetical protein [Nocardioides terrigena]
MKMITGAVIAAAAMLFSGCGGGGETVDSGQAVADMIGCTGWSDTSEERYVTEGGECDRDGLKLGVYYFAADDDRDKFVEAGSASDGNYLIGEGWAIDGPSAVLRDLQGEHGGDLSADG